MFKIGEFSRLTQVSIRMLRHYDETGLLKPAAVGSWTGHRSYSVEQIPRLNKILYLRDSGMNVSEIARALEMDDSALLAELDRKQAEIERTVRAEREKLRKIAIAKAGLQGGKSEIHYNISIKSVPACLVLSLRRTVPTYYDEGGLWQELSAFAKERKIGIADTSFAIYHDADFRERNVDIELCVPVKEPGKSEPPFRFRTAEPVPAMACTMVQGGFPNIKGAYLAFAGWLQDNGRYRMSNPMRQIVHRGPWNEPNPSKYLVELQIPLNRR